MRNIKEKAVKARTINFGKPPGTKINVIYVLYRFFVGCFCANVSDDLLVKKKGLKRGWGEPVGGAGEDCASRGGSSASAI